MSMVDQAKHQFLLVEDDEILRAFLKNVLTRSGYELSVLDSGEAMIDFLPTATIDLIILDRALPGKNGLYWLQWLKKHYEHIPILIASASSSETERLAGLEQGADDYMIKPFHYKELLLRAKNILSNTPSSRNITIGNIDINLSTRLARKSDTDIKLTSIEANLLKILYQNKGLAVSREQIMQIVKGREHNPLDRSIDIHINSLRKKLEDDPKIPCYIQTERGKGYRLNI